MVDDDAIVRAAWAAARVYERTPDGEGLGGAVARMYEAIKACLEGATEEEAEARALKDPGYGVPPNELRWVRVEDHVKGLRAQTANFIAAHKTFAARLGLTGRPVSFWPEFNVEEDKWVVGCAVRETAEGQVGYLLTEADIDQGLVPDVYQEVCTVHGRPRAQAMANFMNFMTSGHWLLEPDGFNCLVEDVAKAVFENREFYGEDPAKPKWINGGNSLRQDQARTLAAACLTAAGLRARMT